MATRERENPPLTAQVTGTTPRARSRFTAIAFLVIVAFVGFVCAAGPAETAQASFVTQCSSPTSVLDPSASSVSVGSGETVLLEAGTFTGGVNSLPTGATLCVAAGAALNPAYMNNAAGSIIVAAGGSTTWGSIAVGTGFDLQVEGSAAFGNLNVNGASTFSVASTGTLTVNGGFSPGSGAFTNDGTMQINGMLSENTNVLINNLNVLNVTGGANINGTLLNTGVMTVTGGMTVNGSGNFTNACQVKTSGTLANNGPKSANYGIVLVGGAFTNNGAWRQTVTGIMSSAGLTDDGAVTGFGTYQFLGHTSVQGSFVGDNAGDPILVQTQAPSGIFDVQTGTVDNVLRIAPLPPIELLTEPKPGCSHPVGGASADVAVTKSGPATVTANGTITYTLTVANSSPVDATNVVLTDVLPSQVTGVVSADGGALTGGVVAWNLGTLAGPSTTTRTLVVSQSSPIGTTLHNVARSVSTTLDPDPTNNDGTSDASQVDTTVVAVQPVNHPPSADPLTQPGFTNVTVLGQVTASDPDADQSLTYTITTQPAHGVARILPDGWFSYQSAINFTGDDSFVYTVCDDGSPVLCANATVSLPISPIAVDDTGQTFEATAVVIPVAANDSLGAQLQSALQASPANGAATVNPAAGTVTYTPNSGFTGVDTFSYRECSPTNATLCAIATVAVTVLAVNHPPVVQPLTLNTTANTPITGAITASDPDAGQTLTFAAGVPPRTGTATVTGASTTYIPHTGFAGADQYTDFACDSGDPILCATGIVTVNVYPVANPDTASTASYTAIDIPVTSNDLGNVTPPTITSGPANGAATVTGNSVTYTPEPGFTGTDTFMYSICATTAPLLCASATVTVTVTASSVIPPTLEPEGGGPNGELADTGAGSVPPWEFGIALVATVAGIASVIVGTRRRKVRRSGS